MIFFFLFYLSFLLDGVLSNLLCFSSYLYPLFSLLSLVVLYPYFKKRDIRKYYFASMIMGFFYDIVYTNTLFLNFILFFLIAILVKMVYNLLPNNFFTLLCISFFIIIVYRLSIYLILLVTYQETISVFRLLKSISSSLLLNVGYIVLFYVILKKIKHKKLF